MRVSIWQQFSSNHSSSFTVVGEFESVEEAQKAGGIFSDIMRRIVQSYAGEKDIENPTSAEIEIGKQYGFEWKYLTDWLDSEIDPQKHVVVFDNFVMVSDLFIQTYVGAHG